ncbi:MAG: flagellar protein FlgN [Verrucomicrobiota bacterium]
MIEKLQDLISALREELQQYGEMLARLDCHQDLVMRRQTDNLLQSIAEIETQGGIIQTGRQQREKCQRALAQFLGLSEHATFAVMIPKLPEEYRPLLQALVQENNELLVRIQQRSRQNHLLLARMVQMMERFMGTLFPATSSPIYTQAGTVFGPAAAPRSLYEAVG